MRRHVIISGFVFLLVLVATPDAGAQDVTIPDVIIPGVTIPGQFPGLSTPGTMDIPQPYSATGIPFIDLTIRNPEDGQEVAFSLQLLLMLTILSLAPSIIILMTSFLRISIVLDFIKRALSLQQVPPNQVLMGIALFMTIFVMWPTFTAIYENSMRPLAAGELSVEGAFREAEAPLRLFMFRQLPF